MAAEGWEQLQRKHGKAHHVLIEKGNGKVSFSELGAPSQKPCICKIPTTRPAGTEKYMTSLGDNYSSPLRLKVHGEGVYSQ